MEPDATDPDAPTVKKAKTMSTNQEQNIDELNSQLLTVAREGKTDEVIKLLGRRCDANYQDPKTGESPLMVAAGAGFNEIVSELLINGAPYNAVDRQGKCAGNYAIDGGHTAIINRLVDAGVTAELLFAQLSKRGRKQTMTSLAPKKSPTPTTDAATSTAESATSSVSTRVNKSSGANVDYFQHAVRYTKDGQQLLDSTDDAVMMEWERPLMQLHASLMIPDGTTPRSLDVLNIGFGLGIIDGFVWFLRSHMYSVCVDVHFTLSVVVCRYLQERQPRTHTIIEAHPSVYAECVKRGWPEKSGVRVLQGRWQDVLARELEKGAKYECYALC